MLGVDKDALLLIKNISFKRLIIPKVDLKEGDFTFIAKNFKFIVELELNLVNQQSLLLDVDLPPTLRTIIIWHFDYKKC